MLANSEFAKNDSNSGGEEVELREFVLLNAQKKVSDSDIEKASHFCLQSYGLEFGTDSSHDVFHGCEIIPFYDRSDKRHAGNIYFKDKEIVIAFQGTWFYSDILTDFNTWFSQPIFLENNGRIHSGFYKKFLESFEEVKGHIDHYLEKRKLKLIDIHFLITGHSMGGCLAKIFALWLNVHNSKTNIQVVSFGSPKVFDTNAAKFYNTRLRERTSRVIQGYADPIPALPPSFLGYEHVGTEKHVVQGDSYPHQIMGYINGSGVGNKLANLASTAIPQVKEGVIGIARQISGDDLQKILTATSNEVDVGLEGRIK